MPSPSSLSKAAESMLPNPRVVPEAAKNALNQSKEALEADELENLSEEDRKARRDQIEDHKKKLQELYDKIPHIKSGQSDIYAAMIEELMKQYNTKANVWLAGKEPNGLLEWMDRARCLYFTNPITLAYRSISFSGTADSKAQAKRYREEIAGTVLKGYGAVAALAAAGAGAAVAIPAALAGGVAAKIVAVTGAVAVATFAAIANAVGKSKPSAAQSKLNKEVSTQASFDVELKLGDDNKPKLNVTNATDPNDAAKVERSFKNWCQQADYIFEDKIIKKQEYNDGSGAPAAKVEVSRENFLEEFNDPNKGFANYANIISKIEIHAEINEEAPSPGPTPT